MTLSQLYRGWHWKHARGSNKAVRVALIDDAGDVVLQAEIHNGQPVLVVDDINAKMFRASNQMLQALRGMLAAANDPRHLREVAIPHAQKVLREVAP